MSQVMLLVTFNILLDYVLSLISLRDSQARNHASEREKNTTRE